MSELDLSHLNRWIGRTQQRTGVLAAAQANLMQATLGREPDFGDGDPLPPAWHWLYFHEAVPAGRLGRDGHAQLGDFMPPVPLPRRMWAGGLLRFYAPLPIGATAIKESTIRSITPKTGRSGRLCFVDVDHALRIDGTVCVDERQTLVYREDETRSRAQQAIRADSERGEFTATIHPDPVLLFRYSALTFNSHRIHYDVDYCRKEEGYPGLVVHGPLTATLLLDLVQQRLAPDRQIHAFEYRAASPLFVPDPFTLHGNADGRLWAADHQGVTALTGRVTLE